MTTSKSVADIRELFLSFFESKGHTRVASSSLIPFNDPTLLFTNAGMNQFKDTFLGLEKRNYTTATSSQKCVRAGGKHNDLDNVGYTARHHTFFEMLGNFSFGDYFKQNAITYAWEFLTSSNWLALPADKLYVTVYHTDDEAANIWQHTVGLPAERIIRIGDNKGALYASDNFWAMGDTGPCGPCTEIFFDHGAHIAGGLPGTPDEDGDRYIEIWNNVFMQFNRSADGTLHPLPAPCVDTGMGLERIAAVLQHVNSNYDIDVFKHIIVSAASILAVEDLSHPSLKVLADHIRSCAFLIGDGVIPSNEGRGYVLRRIIRRAIRHGNKLGASKPFFHAMVPSLVQVMGSAYPELANDEARIAAALLKEEEQFAKTLEQGLKQFEAAIANSSKQTIDGEAVFKLYDTFGFPSDLTADIARERGFAIDEAGFHTAMEQQRKRARDAGKFAVDYNAVVKVSKASLFEGYNQTTIHSAITAMYSNGTESTLLSEGEQALVVLDATVFYAESGGQVGDTGKLIGPSGVFEVQDTKKSGQAIVHSGVVIMGTIVATDTLHAVIDNQLREHIKRNHSATHLLHAVLRNTLGSHIEQKGSLVTADALRFDFSQPESLSSAQIADIETKVNALILSNTAVQQQEMGMQAALDMGAMALFGEKYGEEVRVLSMGMGSGEQPFYSVELCGGTHVSRTGDIGCLKITSESGIAAGIRRIEAKTGMGALAHMQEGDAQIYSICQQTKAARGEAANKVADLASKIKELEKQLAKSNLKLANAQTGQLLSSVTDFADGKLLVAQVDADSKSLRLMLDSIKTQQPQCAIVLIGSDSDKLNYMASIPSNLQARIKAGDIVAHIAQLTGGKGGGKADFAQGGSSAGNVDLNALRSWVLAH